MPTETLKSDEVRPSSSTDLVPRNLGLASIGWLVFSVLAWFALAAPEITRKFETIYVMSSINIPFLTRSFISGRYCWWLLAMAALVLAVRASKDRVQQRGYQRRIAVRIGAVLAFWLCLLVAAMLATYLPIFALGHQVR